MHGVAERIEDRAELVVDVVGQRHDVEGGDLHVLGEGAGDVDADAARLRDRGGSLPAPRRAAPHADDMPLARHALADLEVRARRRRPRRSRRHIRGRRSSARGSSSAPSRPSCRCGCRCRRCRSCAPSPARRPGRSRATGSVCEPEAGLGLGFDERFHVIAHQILLRRFQLLPASVNAPIGEVDVRLAQRRRHLRADAGLALRHDGIEEAGDVDAALVERRAPSPARGVPRAASPG